MTSCSVSSHAWGPLLRRIPLQGLPSVCKSVPVFPPWGFSPLTLQAVAPAFPFPSLLLLLNWDLIRFHTWLYSKPLWDPTLDWWAPIETVLGRSPLSSCPIQRPFIHIFFFVFQDRLPKHHWVVRALRIRLRNLNVIRLLVNSSTNEYFRARHDMTGPVFREVLLQVKEERVK